MSMPSRQQAIALLADLIAFNTESKRSNLAMIAYLKDKLSAHGALCFESYDLAKNKANIFATLPAADGSTDGGILLSGHTDVVPVAGQNWSTDPYKMVQKDDKLYGRGSCDMKGFIAICLAMLPHFAQITRTKPIHFAFSYDEEVGCLGAQVLIDELKKRNITPAVAIIGEPTEMRVIEGHKSCCEYSTHFKGLAGHSSQPDLGVSATEYAVRYITKLLTIRDEVKKNAATDSPFDPPHSTLQIGRIVGGSAFNVIASQCLVEWDLRTVQNSDYDFVHQNIDAYANDTLLPMMQQVHPQASIEKTTISEVKGLQPMEGSKAKALVLQLTKQKQTGVVAFGTEAGLFQQLGVSAVVCGPGSIRQAHKADEFLAIDELEKCLTMLGKLAETISQ